MFPEESDYQEIAILSDFDGVISKINVLEALYKEFSPVDWQRYVTMWENEELSAADEIPLCMKDVKTTRSEMESFVLKLAIDRSFKSLYNYCQSQNHYLAITSDGLRWYIEVLLQTIDIDDIPIFANEIQFLDDGLSFSFPWYDESTPLNGTSKATIVQKIQELGYKVLYIGDGLSDKEAAKVADLVFAKDYLLGWMTEENRPVKEFWNFDLFVENLYTHLGSM